MTRSDPSALLLLPSPRRFERAGGDVDVPEPIRRAVRDLAAGGAADGDKSLIGAAPEGGDTLGRDGFRLRIAAEPVGAGPRPAGLRIEAGTEAGLRHGARTAAQVLAQCPGRVPALLIEDAPAFAVRGVMLDVSRNKIPTMASLESAIDALAALGFNHVQFYTEHAFAYAGHEEVWRGVDPISPDEVRALDDRCARLGIDLCPNQNCFGHLSAWLRRPRYAHLAETHGPWKFLEWDRSGPFSLCPVDERSEAFVRDLLSQLLPCFRSGLVNIGCDETFDVGFGRSAAEVDKRGRAAVYFEFVGKVAAIARSLGRRPMLWADIALNHPESLHLFPPDAIGLAWGYEPDAPFADWCDRLRAHGVEAWVCPGTSSWRSITGRTAERNANLAGAAAQGLARGAAGYLVTDWGDSGHHQHWPVALAALARAAQAAWDPAGLGRFDARAVSLHVFGDRDWDSPDRSIGPWLDRLGDLDLDLRRANALRNNSFLFMDLHRGHGSRPLAAADGQLHDLADRLDALERSRPSAAAVGRLVADELAHTLLAARLAIRHAIAARRPGGASPGDRAALIELLHAVIAEHRRLWLVRNRPGELALSCAHYERIIERLTSSAGAA
jgi:hypothetical protein